jgi:5-methylcytosine-specific restriction enzyme A
LRQDRLIKAIEAMPRNPNWTRNELILALDLYFQAGRKWLDPGHPEVVALSHRLKRFSIHESGIRDANFRNPQGISVLRNGCRSSETHHTD